MEIDKEDFKNKVILEMNRIAKEKNTDVMTPKLWKANQKINASYSRIIRIIPFANLVLKAGLKLDSTKYPKTEDDLGEEFLRVCKSLKRFPNTIIEFKQNTKFGLNTYKRKWGNWPDMKTSFRNWLNIKYPSSEYLNLIPTDPPKFKTIRSVQRKLPKDFVWNPTCDTYFGPPMNFRGLIYEPVNEQGVIFLFGKISEEIGYNIEGLRSGFPDCEGTRRIDKIKNQWGPVLIEFEYNAKNFLSHGHDPSKCDVIICWINDWPDSPIEVLSLKEVIQELTKS